MGAAVKVQCWFCDRERLIRVRDGLPLDVVLWTAMEPKDSRQQVRREPAFKVDGGGYRGA